MRFLAPTLLLIAAPVTAQTAAPTAQTATAVPASATTAAKPKMICQEEESIGTRLGTKKVCMTAEQWKQERIDAATWAQRQQSSAANPGH